MRSYVTGKKTVTTGENARMRAEVAGGGAATAEVGRFLLIKAEKTNERGAAFACLKKKK